MKIRPKEFDRDINGNSIIRFSIMNNYKNHSVFLNKRKIKTDKDSYSYSLQTNGNLPYTHNLKIGGSRVNELSITELEKISIEIHNFLLRHGSDKQKFLIK